MLVLMARKTSIVLLLTALVFTIILWRNARRFDPQLKETLAEVQWELADMYGTGEDAARSQLHPEPEPTVSIPDKIDPASLSKQIVMTRRLSDNVDWVEEEFKDWNPIIYTVDDPKSPYRIPKNKGHEAMVYLSFIIDNYDSLSNVTVFIHHHQFSWHIDAPNGDNAAALRTLHLDTIVRKGYANLRCNWDPGCPGEMHPLSPTHPSDWERRRVEAQEAYANAYRQLFPGIDVPVVVGTTCCAQFAASRTAIRRRPRSDYVHFRKWLLGTKLKDEISGRVFEYVWHIIFGDLNGVGVLCPTKNQCHCDLYGRDCPDPPLEPVETLPHVPGNASRAA